MNSEHGGFLSCNVVKILVPGGKDDVPVPVGIKSIPSRFRLGCIYNPGRPLMMSTGLQTKIIDMIRNC